MPVASLTTVDLNYLQLTHHDSQPTPVQDLVMVHGLAASSAFWYSLANAFSENYRVTLFDLRGHGRSSMPQNGYTPWQMAEDLHELLEYLELEKIHLLGHSFGGSVALHFASKYPDHIESLILADVRLRLLQSEQKLRDWPYWERLRPVLEETGLKLDDNDPESGYQLLEAMAHLQLKTTKENSNLSQLLFPFAYRTGRHAAMRWLKLLDLTTARADFIHEERVNLQRLQQLQIPTLAVYGEYSRTMPTAQALRELWPHAHFEFVSQGGHFFPISHPLQFIGLVQEFLLRFNQHESRLAV